VSGLCSFGFLQRTGIDCVDPLFPAWICFASPSENQQSHISTLHVSDFSGATPVFLAAHVQFCAAAMQQTQD